MTKLVKTDLATREEIAKSLQVAEAAMDAAVTRYNAVVADAFAELAATAGKLNEAISEAANWRDNIVSEQQQHFEDKSEKWQESEAGQNYQAWMDSYEQLELEEINLEEPVEIESPTDGLADELRALEEQP